MRLVDQHSYVATKRKIKRFGLGDDPQTIKTCGYEYEINRMVNGVLKKREHKWLKIGFLVVCSIVGFILGYLLLMGVANG